MWGVEFLGRSRRDDLVESIKVWYRTNISTNNQQLKDLIIVSSGGVLMEIHENEVSNFN